MKSGQRRLQKNYQVGTRPSHNDTGINSQSRPPGPKYGHPRWWSTRPGETKEEIDKPTIIFGDLIPSLSVISRIRQKISKAREDLNNTSVLSGWYLQTTPADSSRTLILSKCKWDIHSNKSYSGPLKLNLRGVKIIQCIFSDQKGT